MTPRLSLAHISKSYGGEASALPALGDISLDVAPGEFLAIVGPSGCGKSTLLKIAAGLIAPSSGTVTENSRAVTGPPDRFVYLFQQYAKSLFPWRKVLDNVLFPLEGTPRAERSAQRDRCREILHQVGLAGFETHYPWQLSGGMQQRVSIARALAASPDVLMLDEPFSAVDALTRMELQSLVLDLWQQKRFTAILVTHDVEEAIFLADRVIVLSARPSVVAEVLTVDLPRPRDHLATREDGRFLALRHHLMTALLGDAARRHAGAAHA
jgi:NitT/TauT family transport system ATP-binding protein